MMLPRHVFACLLSSMGILLLLSRATLAELPPGFVEEPVAHVPGAVDVHYAMTLTKENTTSFLLFAVNKEGQVHVIQENKKISDGSSTFSRTLALDYQRHTCLEGERGMVSVLAHPNFIENHWVYIYYTRKSSTDGCGQHPVRGPRNRLSRFVFDTNRNIIDSSSETVLLQTAPLTENIHHSGDTAFGKDGFLYLTTGDNNLRGEQISQNLGSLMGKVLRITESGDVPLDNPYVDTKYNPVRCNATGIVSDGVCAEIFASGLRNPFRFVMNPNTLPGEVHFLMSEVGGQYWEEVNDGGHKMTGANYGFPTREGPCRFASATDCAVPDDDFQEPKYWYQHEVGGGAAAVGIEIPPKGHWPSKYDYDDDSPSFLHIDFVAREIYHVTQDSDTLCRSCSPPRPGYKSDVFHSFRGAAVGLQFGPYYSLVDSNNAGDDQDREALNLQGALYVAYRRDANPSIRRIVYVGGSNRSPQARVMRLPDSKGNNTSLILVGSPVTLDATSSSDPDGDTLTFDWSFGDGTADIRNGPSVVQHAFAETGTYVVHVTVNDGEASDTTRIEVRAGDPPTAYISEPVEGTTFAVGDVFTVQGYGRDSSGQDLPSSSLSWEVRQHHNVHFHPFLSPTSGNNITISPAPEPEDFLAATNSYLEVRLTVTDSDGLKTTASRNIMPKTVFLEFDSDPSGLEISMDEAVLTMPQRVVSWENHLLRLNALDQGNYTFLAWSNGGERQHSLRVPAGASGATVVATFFSENDELDCFALRAEVNFLRMCYGRSPCCDSIRGDSSYCWDIYDNIFPGNLIYNACYDCCPNKTVGDVSPPLPSLPQTLKCSDLSIFGGIDRLCRNCCRQDLNIPECHVMRTQLGASQMTEACYYCCTGENQVTPPLTTIEIEALSATGDALSPQSNTGTATIASAVSALVSTLTFLLV